VSVWVSECVGKLWCCTLRVSVESMDETTFMYLTCDLPAPPLYPDEMRENIIPQVPLFGILNKFNGVVEKEYKTYKDSTLKRFEITQLPPFIILYIKVLVTSPSRVASAVNSAHCTSVQLLCWTMSCGNWWTYDSLKVCIPWFPCPKAVSTSSTNRAHSRTTLLLKSTAGPSP